LLAQMSLQKQANLGKEGIENYLRSWCKQSYEWSKINTSLLLHESTTISMGREIDNLPLTHKSKGKKKVTRSWEDFWLVESLEILSIVPNYWLLIYLFYSMGEMQTTWMQHDQHMINVSTNKFMDLFFLNKNPKEEYGCCGLW
jgi:hypothetical protein